MKNIKIEDETWVRLKTRAASESKRVGALAEELLRVGLMEAEGEDEATARMARRVPEETASDFSGGEAAPPVRAIKGTGVEVPRCRNCGHTETMHRHGDEVGRCDACLCRAFQGEEA